MLQQHRFNCKANLANSRHLQILYTPMLTDRHLTPSWPTFHPSSRPTLHPSSRQTLRILNHFVCRYSYIFMLWTILLKIDLFIATYDLPLYLICLPKCRHSAHLMKTSAEIQMFAGKITFRLPSQHPVDAARCRRVDDSFSSVCRFGCNWQTLEIFKRYHLLIWQLHALDSSRWLFQTHGFVCLSADDL